VSWPLVRWNRRCWAMARAYVLAPSAVVETCGSEDAGLGLGHMFWPLAETLGNRNVQPRARAYVLAPRAEVQTLGYNNCTAPFHGQHHCCRHAVAESKTAPENKQCECMFEIGMVQCAQFVIAL